MRSNRTPGTRMARWTKWESRPAFTRDTLRVRIPSVPLMPPWRSGERTRSRTWGSLVRIQPGARFPPSDRVPECPSGRRTVCKTVDAGVTARFPCSHVTRPAQATLMTECREAQKGAVARASGHSDPTHTTLGDATATTSLFQPALRLAAPPDLASLGCRPTELPTPWISNNAGILAAAFPPGFDPAKQDRPHPAPLARNTAPSTSASTLACRPTAAHAPGTGRSPGSARLRTWAAKARWHAAPARFPYAGGGNSTSGGGGPGNSLTGSTIRHGGGAGERW